MKQLSQLSTALVDGFSCALSTATVQSQCNRFKQFLLPAQRARMVAAACGLLLALTALPAHAQNCAQPPGGLLAWWPLNETSGTVVADVTGHGHNGVASGAIGPGGPPKSMPGFVGTGLNFFFQGKVTVSPSLDLDFGTGKSFTIDAWIKGHDSPIIGNLGPSHRGYSLYITNGKLTLDIGNGAPLPTTWSGPPITPGVWTFVAVVVDRTNKTVSFYKSTGTTLSGPTVVAPQIPINSDAGTTLPLAIGGCPGNPNGCDMILDEVEIFNHALTQAELQSIFGAGSAGKCTTQATTKGMTWQFGSVNATSGTITVGCGSAPPNRCDPYVGDRPCTTALPLLCFRPFTPPLPVPQSVNDTDFYNRWSGGIVGTTAPVLGSSFGSGPGSLANANAACATAFGQGWRVAEFHDGANGAGGWNFQAYGNVGNSASRFWVDIKTSPNATCWKP
jgi:hypothetical protein